MSLLDFPTVPAQRRPPDDDIGGHCQRNGAGALPSGVASLLAQADAHLTDAEHCQRGAERYVAAHLAALRAATAVVVARRRPRTGEHVASVWRLLAGAAPELRAWAEYFAAGTDRRVVAESGARSVPPEEADSLLARVTEFVTIVHRSLSGVAR